MNACLKRLSLRILGYGLADIRAVEADRALRKMPKGTRVVFWPTVQCYVCNVPQQTVPVEARCVEQAIHPTRSGAVLKMYDIWSAHCSYHGMKENPKA